MIVHPVRRTSFSLDDFAAAIRAACPELSRLAAGIIWAQYALETGRGSACWNNNIGNVKVTQGQAAAGVPLYMLPNTWEIIHGKREVFQPDDPQTWFRWFPDLESGMVHHVGFLRDRRYKPAWPAVLAGDPTAFTVELKRLGYFTAPLQAYAGGMRHLHAEWMREADWEVFPVDPNENTIGGVAHGTHIVDWNNAQREADRRAKLDEEFAVEIAALVAQGQVFGRYDEVA